MRANGKLINRSTEIKEIVRTIIHNREPIIRNVPMQKYLRGAYEPLDRVISFLTSRSLVYRRLVEGGHRNQYTMSQKGCDVVVKMIQECPEATWYKERCLLIQSFFGHLIGLEIRKLQYAQVDYSSARCLEDIVRVEPEVHRRFENLFGEPL